MYPARVETWEEAGELSEDSWTGHPEGASLRFLNTGLDLQKSLMLGP